MNKNLDSLLLALDEEIEKKCDEIKRKKAEQMSIKLFVWACRLFFAVPIILSFAGINLLSACVPVVLFLAVSMFILSPIIINNHFGGTAR